MICSVEQENIDLKEQLKERDQTIVDLQDEVRELMQNAVVTHKQGD